MELIQDILASELPDIEKIEQAFLRITQLYIQHSEQQVEVCRALGDANASVKEQIKMATMKHAQTILRDCYRIVLRRKGTQ